MIFGNNEFHALGACDASHLKNYTNYQNYERIISHHRLHGLLRFLWMLISIRYSTDYQRHATQCAERPQTVFSETTNYTNLTNFVL